MPYRKANEAKPWTYTFRPRRSIVHRPNATENRGWSNVSVHIVADDVLFKLTGLQTGTWAQYHKALWAYIKKNNLQDQEDGRFFRPDSEFAKLMGEVGILVNGFTMGHAIKEHSFRNEVIPLPPPPPEPVRKHKRRPGQGRKPKRRAYSRPNRGTSKMYECLEADGTLAAITGKNFATRSEFLRLTWAYIKKNNLQKPGNGRIVIPNEQLAGLLGNEGREVNGFTMAGNIERHLALKKKTDKK